MHNKVINEEVGIRMFSLSQMTKAKLVCALAWRENFAKGNNSVTDTIRRILDSQLLIGGTSWLSDGEGQSEDVAYHSAISKKYGKRRMPIDNDWMQCRGMGYLRRKGKENRNVAQLAFCQTTI